MIDKLLKIFKILTSIFSRDLPITLGGLSYLYEDITYLFDIPQNNSTKHTFATSILQITQGKTKEKPITLAKNMKRALTNKYAFQMMDEINKEEKAIAEAKNVQDGPRNNQGLPT